MPVVERKNTRIKELAVPADEVVAALGITVAEGEDIQLLLEASTNTLLILLRGPGR